MDETPTPVDIAGIRYAIEKMKAYSGPEGQSAFRAAIAESDPAAAYWITCFAALVDMQLQHVQETYGEPPQAVLEAIEARLARL
jgi:hypothetical protein